MKQIIFDCDNTFGLTDRDVDDGLALLYLLGHPQADLKAITLTYGNSTLAHVAAATSQQLKDLALDLPVILGSEASGLYQSPAADYLVQAVDAAPGQIHILATGSLTNLYGAFLQDRAFFSKAASVTLMGGLTDLLWIGGETMEELNFSCDPLASYHVLREAQNLTILTGHNCLPAYFSLEEYRIFMKKAQRPIADYILSKTLHWYSYYQRTYDREGFYNWDVVAALFLMESGLFTEGEAEITPTKSSLEKGHLLGDGEPISVNLPQIKDADLLKNHVYRTYLKVPYQP